MCLLDTQPSKRSSAWQDGRMTIDMAWPDSPWNHSLSAGGLCRSWRRRSHSLRGDFLMTSGNRSPRALTPGGLVLSAAVTLAGFPAVILLTAGDWRWLEGWIFSLWLDAMVLSNMLYLYRKDPALLAERARRPKSANQQRWDACLLTGAYVMAIVWLLIMPLDAKRFGWSPPFPVWVQVAGGLALVPALYLIYRATVENTYLSTLVRIQAERGQHVIS